MAVDTLSGCTGSQVEERTLSQRIDFGAVSVAPNVAGLQAAKKPEMSTNTAPQVLRPMSGYRATPTHTITSAILN